ncbi:MAG TPA: DUF1801 domain-containing protein [Candidatus Nitrosotalea sp.]|nr:DUF1801 domain-containing protein [Candidatus Nitrosotalea sp.]
MLKDVDAYIASAPKEVQAKLRAVRAAIRGVVPSAVESISYQMPYYAFKGDLSWAERSIAWFGLQSKHIGLYLPPPIIAEHKKDLKGYTTTKSAVHLPLDKKIPVALIKKLVKARMKKNPKE